MKATRFVRFKAEAGETFKSLPMFNHQCVYAVISEGTDEVVIEMHPACALNNCSAKLAVPKTFIEKESKSLMDLLPQGHYKFSPQMLAETAISQANGLWNENVLRDENVTPLINPYGGTPEIGQLVIAGIPNKRGSGVSQLYAAPHWFIPVEPVAPEPTDEPTKIKKAKQPKETDVGKTVRLITGERAGSIWGIYSFDKYRRQFNLFNGYEEFRVNHKDIELITDKEKPKLGTLFTQSARWLNRKRPAGGAIGMAPDHRSVVMRLDSFDAFGKVTVTAITVDGREIVPVSACFEDVRLLTDKEIEQFNQFKGGTSRDEAWCRRVMNKTLIKAIDKCPTSPFLPGMISTIHGISMPMEVKSKEELWAAIIKEAGKIKVNSEDEFVYLDSLYAQPEITTGIGNVPAEVPVPVASDNIPVPIPQIEDDEEIHHIFEELERI